MAAVTRLRFRLPDTVPAPRESFLLDPRKADRWLSDLPWASTGDVARQIYQALVELNRITLPPKVRAQLIERFRHPVEQICTHVRRHYVDAALPLPAKSRKVAALCFELNSNLALSDQYLINDLHAASSKRIDAKLLTLGLYRTVHHLSQMLLEKYLVYSPCPAGVWQDLHRTYRYAEHLQVHNLPIRDKTLPADNPGESIAARYKRTLMLALATPHRLRQREIIQVDEALQHYADKVRLVIPSSHGENPGQFMVDLDTDLPPESASLDNPPSESPKRLLETDDLVRELETVLQPGASADSTPRGGAAKLPKHLLTQLITDWKRAPTRRFSRSSVNAEIDILVGLDAIQDFLARKTSTEAGADHPGKGEDQDERSGNPDLPFGRYPREDIMVRMHAPTELPTAPGDAPVGFEKHRITQSGNAPGWLNADSDTEKEIEVYRCRVVNESDGGCCLVWTGTHAPIIKVGELVGLRQGEADRLSVGVIRWLQDDPEAGLSMGLKSIGPEPRPVELHGGGGADHSVRRGLLLSEVQAYDQPVSLIVPTLAYRPGNRLELVSRDSTLAVRLSDRLESTRAFCQYDFDRINDGSGTSADDGSKADAPTDDDFDTIWSSL